MSKWDHENAISKLLNEKERDIGLSLLRQISSFYDRHAIEFKNVEDEYLPVTSERECNIWTVAQQALLQKISFSNFTLTLSVIYRMLSNMTDKKSQLDSKTVRRVTIEINNNMAELFSQIQKIIDLARPETKVVEELNFLVYKITENALYGDYLDNSIFTEATSIISHYKAGRPRYLTDTELDFLLEPLTSGELKLFIPNQELEKQMRMYIVNVMRKTLEEMKLSPYDLANYRKVIYDDFEIASIDPGNTVGMTAAEATSAPLTQMILNSFHTAGDIRKINLGFEFIKQLLGATRELTNNEMYIHFRNKQLHFADLIHMKRKLEAVTLKDVIDNYYVVSYDMLEAQNSDAPGYDPVTDTTFYADFFQAGGDSTILPLEDIPSYVSSMLAEQAKDFIDYSIADDYDPSQHHLLVIQLDPEKLYFRGVTPSMFANALVSNSYNNKDKVCTLYAIPSSIEDAIVHVFVNEHAILNISNASERTRSLAQDNPTVAVMDYLAGTVVSTFDKLIVRGIPGIKKVYPIAFPIWQVVQGESLVKGGTATPSTVNEKLSAHLERIGKGKWKASETLVAYDLVINELIQRFRGISLAVFYRLLDFLGISYDRVRNINQYQVVRAYLPVSGLKISQLVNELVALDKARPDYLSNRDSEIYENLNYFYVETDGTNMERVLSLFEVDTTATYCNQMHYISKYWGIEAANNFMTFIMDLAYGITGSYVSDAHIRLVVDMMTHRGVIVPVTYGFHKQTGAETLEQAAGSRPFDVIKEGAITAVTTSAVGPSSRTITGGTVNVGTGVFQIVMTPEQRAEYLLEEEEAIVPEGINLSRQMVAEKDIPAIRLSSARSSLKEMDFYSMNSKKYSFGIFNVRDSGQELPDFLKSVLGMTIKTKKVEVTVKKTLKLEQGPPPAPVSVPAKKTVAPVPTPVPSVKKSVTSVKKKLTLD